MSRKKLVIDCDVGTDDAQAILMALAYPEEVEIVAITAVYGNATLEHTARNTLRLLKFCDRLDVSLPTCKELSIYVIYDYIYLGSR